MCVCVCAVGCMIGRAQANICAEKSDGKWCCERQARNICHTLTYQRVRLHAHTSTHGWGLRRSDTSTPTKHRSGSVFFLFFFLSRAINHPSSNCPRLPRSLTICSLTTSPYNWQTVPSTTVVLGNRGVYQGPPSLLEWFLLGKPLKVW